MCYLKNLYFLVPYPGMILVGDLVMPGRWQERMKQMWQGAQQTMKMATTSPNILASLLLSLLLLSTEGWGSRLAGGGWVSLKQLSNLSSQLWSISPHDTMTCMAGCSPMMPRSLLARWRPICRQERVRPPMGSRYVHRKNVMLQLGGTRINIQFSTLEKLQFFGELNFSHKYAIWLNSFYQLLQFSFYFVSETKQIFLMRVLTVSPSVHGHGQWTVIHTWTVYCPCMDNCPWASMDNCPCMDIHRTVHAWTVYCPCMTQYGHCPCMDKSMYTSITIKSCFATWDI